MARTEDSSRIAVRTRKTRAHNLRLVRAFVFVILLVIAFWGGFAVRGNSDVLASLGFSQYVVGQGGAKQAASDGTKDTYNSLSARVSEVEDLLDSESLDSYSLEDATAPALEGFAQASDDKYLRYYTQARYQALMSASAAGYDGIGVLFSEYEGKAYAVDVFEGSEAQLAGVSEGDFVVAIDGDRGQGWTQGEAAAATTREDGSTVVVTWRHPETLESDGGTEYTTTLTCRSYSVPNVTTELDDGVGYIKVAQLTQSSSEMVGRAIADLEEQGAGAYVLDLRDDPGGYLTQAVDIAGLFMQSGTVVQIRTGSGTNVKTATSVTATSKPLVVLVNGNTAAGAEVVAAALKESQRATVIGATTMGKGSVQVVHELSFGGAMRYTAAHYLSPQGHDIDGVGVSPDVAIDAVSGGDDNQLSYAMETARSLIEG